jgi:hypothetical protein
VVLLCTALLALCAGAAGGEGARPIEIVAASVARSKPPLLAPGASIHVPVSAAAKPEEQRVASRITEVLKRKGYRVVGESEPHYVLLFSSGTSPLLGTGRPDDSSLASSHAWRTRTSGCSRSGKS